MNRGRWLAPGNGDQRRHERALVCAVCLGQRPRTQRLVHGTLVTLHPMHRVFEWRPIPVEFFYCISMQPTVVASPPSGRRLFVHISGWPSPYMSTWLTELPPAGMGFKVGEVPGIPREAGKTTRDSGVWWWAHSILFRRIKQLVPQRQPAGAQYAHSAKDTGLSFHRKRLLRAWRACPRMVETRTGPGRDSHRSWKSARVTNDEER